MCKCVCVFVLCVSVFSSAVQVTSFVLVKVQQVLFAKAIMMVVSAKACPLLGKLPQRKKSTDPQEDRKLLKEDNALKEIIQLAWSNPSKRLSFLADMKLELESEQDDVAARPDTMFAVAPQTLGHVCIEWVAGFLQDTWPLLSDTVLGLIRAADSGNLRSLQNHGLHATGTLKWPPSCQDKRVLKDLLKHRLATLGQVRLQTKVL